MVVSYHRTQVLASNKRLGGYLFHLVLSRKLFLPPPNRLQRSIIQQNNPLCLDHCQQIRRPKDSKIALPLADAVGLNRPQLGRVQPGVDRLLA